LLIRVLDYKILVNELKNAKLFPLLSSFISIPLIISLRSLKWQILLKSFWQDISFIRATTSYLLGFSIGIVTPAKIGEVARAIYLPYSDKKKIAGLVILDRYCDLVILTFLAVPGAIRFIGIEVGIIILCAGLFGISVFFIYPSIISFYSSKNFQSAWINKILNKLVEYNEIPKRVISTSLLLSLCIFILSVMTSYLLVFSFTFFSPANAFEVFPIALFTNILPITIGNLGVRESVTIFLLDFYTINKEIAFNSSVMLFFLHSFIPAIIGLIIMQFRYK